VTPILPQSGKDKRPYALMRAMADALVAKLTPACTRIEIAGSIRREAAEAGDIELVAIPKFVPDLFGDSSAITEVDLLLPTLPIRLLKNGKKYKQFTFDDARGRPVQVDLFLQTDPATWGVNFLLRTGSDAFARRMVTPRLHNGYMPDGFRVLHARVWRAGAALSTPEEHDIFDLWGMPFAPPRGRMG
jgi:DNA polymerase/3'-5' exonuclease PolX